MFPPLVACFIFVVPALSLTSASSDEGYIAAADFLKFGMKTDIEPCDDFYGFMCGNIESSVKAKDPDSESYSTWGLVSANFTQRIVDLLDGLKPADTPIPQIARKVKLFWKKCLKRKNTTRLIVASLKDAMELTKVMGGAPLFNANWKQSSDQTFFTHAMEVHKRFDIEFGLQIRVSEDLSGGRNVMYMYMRGSLVDPEQVVKIHAKMAEMTGKSTVSDAKIAEQQTEMEEAKDAFSELISAAQQSSSYSYKLITLKDMYEYVPDLAQSFADQGVGNASHIYTSESTLNSVKAIVPLLSKYSKYRRAMQNFLMGAYFKKVTRVLEIDPLTNIEYNETEEALSPFTFDRSGDHETYDTAKKDMPADIEYCMEKAVTDYSTGLFEHAVLRLFVEEHGPRKSEALKLRQMMDLVREQLRRKVFHASWLDFTSKIRAMNKLTSIIPRIAYQLWIVNDTALNAYFKNLGSFSNSDSYLKLWSKAQGNKWLNQLDMLNRPVAQDYNDFGMSSFYTNAWYQPDRNAFAITLGIMQPPFYRADYPPALIYGIIAAITGHEIVHGFDKSGVQRDLEGKRERWMSEESYEEFSKRAKCVEDQYSNFCYNLTTWNSDDEYEMVCINGPRKASENIADIDGNKAAYKAYKAYAEKSGTSEADKKLPGLESYSWDQVYFMAYAALWCQMKTVSSLRSSISYGAHSPGPSRVNGTLQNMPSFAEAFNCRFGSKMNPTEKCHVW